VIAAAVGAIPLQIMDGNTGYFYRTPRKTAQKVVYLMENPGAAESMGKRGRDYVEEHFLLPDRIADYLTAIHMVINGAVSSEVCTQCIISFHPWFKLSKRMRTRFL